MFIEIGNTPKSYDWGSLTAIPELLGVAPSGGPQAELWFGTHEASPSIVVNRESTNNDLSPIRLHDWLSENQGLGPGEPTRIGFLLKILAAETPLSIQAHPNSLQAEQGFTRENEQQIPIDAPERNYRDPFAKPELVLAISERFEALAGMRSIQEIEAAFKGLGADELVELLGDLPSLIRTVLSGGREIQNLVSAVQETASSSDSMDADTVRRISRSHPHDPAILCALMLNRVSLRRGEALFLGAGNLHAYLQGTAIELMGPSDNVLRGGLTSKHVDVEELLAIADLVPRKMDLLVPEVSGNHRRFNPRGIALRLDHIIGPTQIDLSGESIALCTDGEFEVSGEHSSHSFRKGEAAFITANEQSLRVVGTGEIFIASAPAASKL
ncbi:MAG: mannose-6-phosphate isomerase, class I [Microbacteriaceae bacterium]|nr:mannose-6-phosphate isomerase, class I [Microbacteriaceae bacterium]